jgi:hypothetical protein
MAGLKAAIDSAPLAMTLETARGIDFNLNSMKKISFGAVSLGGQAIHDCRQLGQQLCLMGIYREQEAMYASLFMETCACFSVNNAYTESMLHTTLRI